MRNVSTTVPGEVLFVVSSATTVALADGSQMPTGFWAGELVQPWRALGSAGFALRLATPGGLRPQPDPASMGREPEVSQRALDAISDLEAPEVLESIDPESAANLRAIVLPGGYAPMTDLTKSSDLGHLLAHAHAAEVLVAAICHAPAALLSCCRPNGWIYAGYRMAVFTDAEEDAWLGPGRLARTAQSALTSAGAICLPGPPWAAQVVRDRDLLTAQNSPSCRAWTDALLTALSNV